MGLKLCLFLFFSLMACNLSSQENFQRKTFVSNSNDSLNYRLLVPQKGLSVKKYPLVIFLHGAGHRGKNNIDQLLYGGQMWLNPLNRSKFPAYVIFPQCPLDCFGAYPEWPQSFSPYQMPLNPSPTSFIKSLKDLIDSWLLHPSIDKKRIYLVGLSMGAMAVYDLTVRYPEIFSAAVAICGTVNPKRLTVALKPVAFRIFHGDADDVVPVEGSRVAFQFLDSLNVDVQYTEFVGCKHNSWDSAFNQPDFMSWLFEQSR